MEDASLGNFGDVYGNVYDAYAKSTEDGIRVTKAIITEMKEAGVAGDVIAQMEIQMKNLNTQLERTPGSLQEMNSAILEGRAQWVAALDTMNQKVIEAAQTTGQLPAFVMSAFQNADPVISQSAVSLMANFMSAVKGGIDPGVAQQIAQTLFDTGTFTATGVESIDAALAQIAAQIKADALAGVGDKLSQAWGKVSSIFAGGPEKKEVEVVVTETGSTQAIKGLGEVNKLIGRVDGKKAETKVTANTKSAKKSVNNFLENLPKTYQIMITAAFKVNPVFSHPLDAGKYIGEQFAAGMGTPQLDIDADAALNSVLDAFGANVEGGFLQQQMSKEFREVEEAIMAITSQSGAHLGAWRNLRGEMDKSKATLDGYNAAMDKSQDKVEALQREQQKLQDSISDSNGKISKANELLTKMGQIKLRGETASDEKSYQLQLAINKLELERLNINERLQSGKGTNADYDRLYQLAQQKKNLEEEKAIVDLQSTVTYDAQRHAIEAALDPLHGQEMTQYQILKTIQQQQGIIAAENASIAQKQIALQGIEAQIKRELDAQWLLKIEIENTQKVYDNLKSKVDEFANYFKSRYQEMIAEAQELQRAQEKALGGGTATIDTEYKANPTFKHPADLVKYINRTLSSGLDAQRIAINAPVPGVGMAGGAHNDNSSRTEIFHVDTIIMNGVQSIDEMVKQAKLKAQVL
jgi:ACT domain-containing protein